MKSYLQIYLLLVILIFIFNLKSDAQRKDVSLYKGIVITHSVKIRKAAYQLKGADSLSAAPIVIEGDNITVDFNGASIIGNSDMEHPDQFTGTGIIVKGGHNITLKNLTVKGFKVGVMGRAIKALRIIHGDFSYNFRQRLNSTRKREDLADWMSYHHNEQDEWLRFGAGIYLRNCDSIDIHDNVVTDGQCGLMMTGCNDGIIYNNNFSFNSGIGIGMYRSCRNRVLHNKVDWNVRGFSFGVYYRGQDSAGILVFEQSSNNVFAYNSVTHSGDGFFLWGGQTTLDTGEGGCNDNLIYANDFSYAPTNAVEITFSRNRVIKNILHDSWHGIWAGFSYNTIIANNDFADNLSSIAIEHGQNNIIDQNTFQGDHLGLELWSQPNRVKDIGFMEKRDTRSMGYHISNNSFTNMNKVLAISNSEKIVLSNNLVSGSTVQQSFDSTVKDLVFVNLGNNVRPVRDDRYDPKLKEEVKGRNAMLEANHPKGKMYIMMTPWGPYNFRYPMVWWTKTDSTSKMYFDIWGPEGQWKIKKLKGVSSPVAVSGKVPGQLCVQMNNTPLIDIDIELEFRGDEVVSPFGVKYAAGRPYVFHFKEFAVPLQWQMKWFAFDSSSDPVKNETSFRQLLASAPVKVTEGNDLSRVFEQGFGKNIAKEKVATISTAEIEVPEGLYRVGISASELARVYIDGKLIIDSWDPAKKIYDADYHKETIMHLKGKHTIRIEQAQFGSYGMLFLVLQPTGKNGES